MLKNLMSARSASLYAAVNGTPDPSSSVPTQAQFECYEQRIDANLIAQYPP